MDEYTENEWLQKGYDLHGKDKFKWLFKCPNCGRKQSPNDFKQFKDKGANPNSAYEECIGRYTGGKNGPDKCDWAAYGLFRGPVKVTLNNGGEIWAFDFADKESEG